MIKNETDGDVMMDLLGGIVIIVVVLMVVTMVGVTTGGIPNTIEVGDSHASSTVCSDASEEGQK